MSQSYRSLRYYRDALLRPETWKRALRGDINLKGISSRMRTLAEPRLKRYLPAAFRGTDFIDLESAFTSLSGRGVYLETHLGTKARKLRGAKGFRLELTDGADHTFTRVASQRMLSKMIADHLQRALPWSSKPAPPLRAVPR